MPRSCSPSAQLALRVFRYVCSAPLILASLALAGCQNSCFLGFSNNGNGGLIVKSGNPPPTCSLTQAQGTMHAAIVRAPACANCTSAARVEHIFLTLRGIQLHPGAVADLDSADWIEIAPQLANTPLQIDLIEDVSSKIVLENTSIPAGTYRQVRLQFLGDSSINADLLPAKNLCGGSQYNCVVMGDRRVQPPLFRGKLPELLLSAGNIEGGSLVLLPGGSTELRLHLEARQAYSSSSTEPWKSQVLLVGRATPALNAPLE